MSTQINVYKFEGLRSFSDKSAANDNEKKEESENDTSKMDDADSTDSKSQTEEGPSDV